MVRLRQAKEARLHHLELDGFSSDHRGRCLEIPIAVVPTQIILLQKYGRTVGTLTSCHLHDRVHAALLPCLFDSEGHVVCDRCHCFAHWFAFQSVLPPVDCCLWVPCALPGDDWRLGG